MPTVEAMLMIIVLPTVTRAIIPATARGIIMMDGDFRKTNSESTRRARSAACCRGTALVDLDQRMPATDLKQ